MFSNIQLLQLMLTARMNTLLLTQKFLSPKYHLIKSHHELYFCKFNDTCFPFRMGAHYRRSGFVGTEQDIDVAQIITHENYHNPLRYSHDIALLKLAKPAKMGKGVGLACLPYSVSPSLPLDNPNKKCWITGWGTLSLEGSQPNALMQASVPLVSKQRCLKGYPGAIHDSMLCAGLDEGGVDACQGDSGGPLVCEYNGKWYLEGATSWGHGCERPNKYGVYAKVRGLMPWILKKMNGNVVPPPPETPTPPQPTTTQTPPTTTPSGNKFLL